jgi:hypothetical protein
MPFAALLGGLLAGTAANLLFYIGDLFQFGDPDGSCFFRFVNRTIADGVAGYAFSAIAARVAPSGKYTAAVVMTTILGAACVVLAVLTWFTAGATTLERFIATLSAVAMIIGAVIATAEIRS